MRQSQERLLLLFSPFLVIFVFIPSEIFVYNQIELGQDILLLWYFVAAGLCAYSVIIALLALTYFFSRPLYHEMLERYPWLFFTLALYLLLHNLFIPFPISGEALGTPIDGASLYQPALMEAGLFLLMISFYRRASGHTSIAAQLVLILLLLLSGRLAYASYQTYQYQQQQTAKQYTQQQAVFQQNQLPNIYQIHLDGMQTDFWLKVLADNQFENAFSGFKVYRNNISNYTYTQESVSSYLSGRLDKDIPYDSGQLQALHQLNYHQTVIGLPEFTNSPYLNQILNNNTIFRHYTSLSHPQAREFISIWFMRVMPTMMLKITSLTGYDLGYYLQMLLNDGKKPIHTNIVGFGYYNLKYLKDAESQRPSQGQYLLNMSAISHHPYYLGKDCEAKPHSDPKDVANNYIDQITCGAQLTVDFIEELKKLGRYDDAIIIINADHGAGFPGFVNNQAGTEEKIYHDAGIVWSKTQLAARAAALLMIKPAHSQGPMTVSEQRTQLIDLYPTLMGLLETPTSSPIDGIDLLSCLDSQCSANKRPFLLHTKDKQDNITQTFSVEVAGQELKVKELKKN